MNTLTPWKSGMLCIDGKPLRRPSDHEGPLDRGQENAGHTETDRKSI